MNVADIGVITNVKGNIADVQIRDKPLLLNLPIVSLSVDKFSPEHSLKSGDKVLVVYVKGNINNGVIVGKFVDEYDTWYRAIRGVLNE